MCDVRTQEGELVREDGSVVSSQFVAAVRDDARRVLEAIMTTDEPMELRSIPAPGS